MVTGVQLVTGGEVHTGSTRGFNTGAGVEVDGSAIAALPPDVARAKADVNIDYSSGASAEYGHEDERVWAAQFMDILIDPKPHPDKEARKQGRLAVDVMSLKPPVDLRSRGMRRFRENNAPTNGHMNGPEATALLHLEDTDIDDALSDLAFDERPYHAAIGRIDWDKYALASQYENDLKTSSESEGSESDDEASITVS